MGPSIRTTVVSNRLLDDRGLESIEKLKTKVQVISFIKCCLKFYKCSYSKITEGFPLLPFLSLC